MSNALAIAGVTATLKDLLDDGVANGGLDALDPIEVTARPVDTIVGETEKNRLNIYPWKVTHNPAFVNDRLASHDGAGNRIASPRLGLTLHYIMTATGSADFNAEILLGYGMQQLHEHPALTPDDIRAALPNAASPVTGAILPAAHRLLAASTLADQVERLRIMPEPSNDDELSKIWPAFNTALRMSAFYRVSVVLIEATRTIEPGPPVRSFALDTMTLRRPRIGRIVAQEGGVSAPLHPGGRISAGSRISILGSGLASENMVVHLGKIPADLGVSAGLSAGALSVLIPDTMPAGLHLVTVEHREDRLGEAALVLECSNSLALRVAPDVTGITLAGSESNEVVNGNPETVLTGTATVTLSNPVDADQSLRLFLDPVTDGKPGRSFPRIAATAPSTSAVFALENLIVGDYVWRLYVEGGESLPATLTFEAP